MGAGYLTRSNVILLALFLYSSCPFLFYTTQAFVLVRALLEATFKTILY